MTECDHKDTRAVFENDGQVTLRCNKCGYGTDGKYIWNHPPAPKETCLATNRLRFVEREIMISATNPYGKPVRVLQQWWMSFTTPGHGEWRDVPLEAE